MPRLQNAVILVLDQTAAAGVQAIASTFTATMAFTIMDAMARVRTAGAVGTTTQVNNGGAAITTAMATANSPAGTIVRTALIAVTTKDVAVGAVLTTAIVNGGGDATAVVDCFVTGFAGNTSLSQVP